MSTTNIAYRIDDSMLDHTYLYRPVGLYAICADFSHRYIQLPRYCLPTIVVVRT